MKIAKATITALLYTSKTLANGEHPVMIRVCYNGKRKYKSTGLSCPAKLWNTAKQEVRGRHPLSMNMNALIESELMCLKTRCWITNGRAWPIRCRACSRLRGGNRRRAKRWTTCSKNASPISGTPCRNTIRRPATRRCGILSDGIPRTGRSSCSTWTRPGCRISNSTSIRATPTRA